MMTGPLLRIVRAALVAAALVIPSFVSEPTAAAAPRWVDRPVTLPRLVFAGDAGVGIGFVRFDDDPDRSRNLIGPGLNLEAAIGVTDSIELGLRTGLRIGNDAKLLGADAYGRTLFTETYGTGFDALANPEFKFRWSAYSGRVVEVGLDARLFIPIETGTRVGIMPGVPLAFHIGDFLRIDTGLYLPIVLTDPTSTVISVPGYFWFQVSRKVWLGPMVGLRHVDPGGPVDSRDDVLFGFGLGYQVASSVDLKWMVFSPRVNADRDEPRIVGVGFGLQFRIGE